jgi:ethanolamine utilization protein EutA
LPLRNVPVVRVDLPSFLRNGTENHPLEISKAIKMAVQRWDIQSGMEYFSLSLDFDQVLDYDQLRDLALGLELFSRELPDYLPVIVIIKKDYAQVLGQTLKALVGKRSLLIIDQVGLEEGDFIDIGLPLMDGRVVPLIVKTLVFYH